MIGGNPLRAIPTKASQVIDSWKTLIAGVDRWTALKARCSETRVKILIESRDAKDHSQGITVGEKGGISARWRLSGLCPTSEKRRNNLYNISKWVHY